MHFDKPITCSKKTVTAPQSSTELLARCNELAGKTLGQIAASLGLAVPDNLQRHKGWVGALFEQALGADAGSRAEPDFIGLGIEMKTLPLNKSGLPKESTYVCTVSMQQNGALDWHQSWIRRKLSCVLWVPVEADHSIPLSERYVGQAWLWQPNAAQEAQLQRDWEELMDRVVLGGQAEITAKEGEYLQIRPKAAHGRIVSTGISAEGLKDKVNPKGFYLRPSFTRLLLEQG